MNYLEGRPACTVTVDDLGVVMGGTVLLASVSFFVPAGHLVVLRGRNGSGKTTLLRVLSGEISGFSGDCRVLGLVPDAQNPDFRAEVAAAVEDPPISAEMTLGEQLNLTAASWFYEESEIHSRVEGLVARLELEPLLGRFPHELSAGQRQLFSFGLHLIRPGRVLLIDEPERHLDEDRAQRVAEILRERAAEGSAVIVATHSPTLEQAAHEVLSLKAPSHDAAGRVD